MSSSKINFNSETKLKKDNEYINTINKFIKSVDKALEPIQINDEDNEDDFELEDSESDKTNKKNSEFEQIKKSNFFTDITFRIKENSCNYCDNSFINEGYELLQSMEKNIKY